MCPVVRLVLGRRFGLDIVEEALALAGAEEMVANLQAEVVEQPFGVVLTENAIDTGTLLADGGEVGRVRTNVVRIGVLVGIHLLPCHAMDDGVSLYVMDVVTHGVAVPEVADGIRLPHLAVPQHGMEEVIRLSLCGAYKAEREQERGNGDAWFHY